MTAKITFNGKEYSSPEEMPPEERQAYERLMGVFEDKDRDGTPDVFESLQGFSTLLDDKNRDGTPDVAEDLRGVNIITSAETYTNPAEVPPEFRPMVDQAMGLLKEAGAGSAQVVFKHNPAATAGEQKPITPTSPNPPQEYSPVIQNVGTPLWVGLVFVGVLIAAAIGLALIMMRVLQ